jgi:3-oxoadipate enol-lactonase
VSPLVAHDVLEGPPGAPTVVLSNSLGSTRAMWDRAVNELAEHFTVVRYDTRGHGDTPVEAGPTTIDVLADDVVELLEHLGIERAHLVGLSLGGTTMLRLAAREPSRVDRVVALCTAAQFPPPSAWIGRAAQVRAEGTSSVAPAVVARWYSPAFLASEPDRVAAAEEMVAATPAEGYAACCEALALVDLRPDLVHIEAPVLAIAGADDPATPPAWLEVIAEGVRDGRLLVVPESAHLAVDEQPETVTRAIIDHLRGDS